MSNRWTRLSRKPRLVALLTVCLMAAGLAMPIAANALPALFDGRFYYTGGDVTIDVLHYDSMYDEVLQLRTALGVVEVANGSQIGSKAILTAKQLADMGIGVGDELQFALHVRNTGHDFTLGSGDTNADGVSHAYIRPGIASRYTVGFEDLYGGGDRDYHDTVFRFSGGLTTSPIRDDARLAQTTQVAQPSMLLLLLPAVGLLVWKRRAK